MCQTKESSAYHYSRVYFPEYCDIYIAFSFLLAAVEQKHYHFRMIYRTQIMFLLDSLKDLKFIFSNTFLSITRITGGSYQALFKTFYSKSNNKVFQKFSKLYVIGPSVLEGLQQALEHK